MHNAKILNESPKCFEVDLNQVNRIDAQYFNPVYYALIKEIKKTVKKNKNLELYNLSELLREKPTGGATPKGAIYPEEGVIFIRVQNVRENQLVLDDVKFIERRIHQGKLKRSQLKPNDVLLTITGATYGIACTVPPYIKEANMNQHCVRLRVDENKILPHFLSYYLNSKYGKIQNDRNITGYTRPALDYGAVNSLKIILPNEIALQKQILKKTSKYEKKAKIILNKYNSIIDKIKEVPIKELKIKFPTKQDKKIFLVSNLNQRGRFDATFNTPYLGALKNEIKKSPFKKLGEIVKIAKKEKIPFSDFYKLVELEDIDEKLGEIKGFKETPLLESEKILFKENQLVISKIQPEKGKIIKITKELDGFVGSSELIPLEIIDDDTQIDYLGAILRSNYVLDQWEHKVTGYSRPRIGKKELYKTLIPYPDKKIRTKIINETQNLVIEAKKLKAEFDILKQKAKQTFEISLISEL